MGTQEPLPDHGSNRPPYNPFAEHDFDQFVKDTLADFPAPGLAIAVVHGDQTFSKGYGHASLEPEVAMTPRTLFYAGSTTKSFTAALTSKLVDSQDSDYAHIGWNTKLVDIIREDFVLQDEHAINHINLIDALSHRTGFPRHDLTWINGDPSLRDTVRQMRSLPFHNELRMTWEYCNLMYHAVAHAIETMAQQSAAELLRKWIWTPLGMNETFYSIGEALECEKKVDGVTMARGYLWDIDTKSFVQVEWADLPPSTGAGGVLSNVLDYTKWMRTFLHASTDSNPISESAIEKMTAAHIPLSPNPASGGTGGGFYGLGLESGIYKGYLHTGHNGAINGYMSTMKWFPALDFGVVIFQNAYSMAFEVIMARIIDDFLQTGKPCDAAASYRAILAHKAEALAHAKQKLYPNAPAEPTIQPALPLEAYMGEYSHPAYKNWSITIGQDGSLSMLPAGHAYLNVTGTLYHVNGENWWVHLCMGPSNSLVDVTVRANFELGVEGKVATMWLQAEEAMDNLIEFKKIA